ncbi:MAG: dihydroorotase [Kiritimatiellia bacterium]
MKIDPHVHCRDGAENYKETIAHVMTLCDQQGVDMVFDMPNTSPPLLTAADLEQRLRLVPDAARDRYRVFLGATADPEQLRQAVELVHEREEVVGLKLFAGPSVGALAIASESAQQMVYRALAEFKYQGIIALHCEKESLFHATFDPMQPSTHALARPPEAENESIRDQINFAGDAGFQGTLHICHISGTGALDVIRCARAAAAAGGGGPRLTCAVTPHHLLWSSSQMNGTAGLLYKVNPPLREPSDNIALRTALKQGEIDWIETDHAPHPLCDKIYPPYASGFPSLCLYRNLVEEVLPFWGMDEDAIRRVTCDNICRTFGISK